MDGAKHSLFFLYSLLPILVANVVAWQRHRLSILHQRAAGGILNEGVGGLGGASGVVGHVVEAAALLALLRGADDELGDVGNVA